MLQKLQLNGQKKPMMNILALLQCIQPNLSKTNVRRMSRIAQAMLSMTGRVTMLGLSRWAGKGGSYRTVQRFFAEQIAWPQIFWQFFKAHLFDSGHTYILAGDECVISKSGKHTHGLDYFFSGLANRPIKSVAIFAFSLIDVETRRSHPIRVKQRVRSPEEKQAAKAKKEQISAGKKRCKPGRPKGSKNRNKQPVALSPELKWVQEMLKQLLKLISGLIPVRYLTLDGHFGNRPALQMVSELRLHLISKLRSDSALYLPYNGEHVGRGAPRKYGERIDYDHLPEKYLVSHAVEDHFETHIYQIQVLHKTFPQPLNVVIIKKMNQRNGKVAHAILFSSDLELSYDQMIDFYSLRFQIEFNFRDAKQHWGLEDFMNVKPVPLTNALNLSLFMVSLSHALLPDFRQSYPQSGVLDLKAYFRAARYFEELLKLLPQRPDIIFNHQTLDAFLPLGCIHVGKVQANSP
jgi:putative transposase